MKTVWRERRFEFCLLVIWITTSFSGHSKWLANATCSSLVSEQSRIDCHPASGATEAKCRCKGCQWCTTASANVPWCFHNSYYDELAYLTLRAECPSCTNCRERIDCHPEPDATLEKCRGRSCLWCPDAYNEPWCIYGGLDLIESFKVRCPTCSNCAEPVNCLPGEVSPTEAQCLTKGCIWCSSLVPQCRYGGNMTAPDLVRSNCQTCNTCTTKYDCHPEPDATEAKCIARHCSWCVSSSSGDPWCVYGSTAAANCSSCANCNTKIDCHPEPYATKWSCEYRGCFWCPTTQAGVPFCVHPTK